METLLHMRTLNPYTQRVGEKCYFDCLISGCEVESAVIGNKEEEIIENSANEHLVFKRGITDDCNTLNSTPLSPVMPIIDNCVEEKKCSKTSGVNLVSCENHELIHSNGSSGKCCFDSLIIECESVGKVPGHIFRDSDNERAMIGHKEEEIVEDSADEDLVFQSGFTD